MPEDRSMHPDQANQIFLQQVQQHQVNQNIKPLTSTDVNNQNLRSLHYAQQDPELRSLSKNTPNLRSVTDSQEILRNIHAKEEKKKSE